MISNRMVDLFCKEDPSLIENYDLAVADTEHIWHCHHRDEIRELPSGMVALRSKKDLMENGRYYHCPANELIFLTHNEHSKLHRKYDKTSPHKGKKMTDEAKAKISAFQKGRPSPKKGTKMSEEQKQKISITKKLRWAKYRANREVTHNE